LVRHINNQNITWSAFTAILLHHLGIRYACISPGARNSPLTYTFTEKSGITCFSHVDERSSAFFALGLAKSSLSPVVLISTSGTAPANFYPAVIEASLSRIPLIILSADRPNYLVGSGANQTINQQNLYGNHVRYFEDVGLPTEKMDDLKKYLIIAFQNSVGYTLKYPPGPVHLNFPFDEPLLPEKLDKVDLFTFGLNSKPKMKLNFQIPILQNAKRPLIIAGPMEGNSHQKDMIAFGEKINAPILADPLSQLRYGFDSKLILSHYDIFCRYTKLQPDLIIRFGRKPTSKILCQLLKKWRNITILIDAWQKFNDDSSHSIQSSISQYCREQLQNVIWEGGSNWVNQLLSLESIVENEIQGNDTFHEGNIIKICLKSIQDKGCFIIGNSMPIRNVDMFTSTSKKLIHTYSNRGASGIDGVISTALGISIEKNTNNALLIIGDLSFYHDMNGLLALKYGMNISIVVINNKGGGIFSFMPISNSGLKKYDLFWTTDTCLDIEKVAHLYNCRYYLSKDLNELGNNIQESFNIKGVKIIEVKTIIDENITAHKILLDNVQRLISEI